MKTVEIPTTKHIYCFLYYDASDCVKYMTPEIGNDNISFL